MAETTGSVGSKKKGSGKIKLLLALIVFLIFILIAGLLYFQYILFKTKAEGIALGYKKALVGAYQAQRPLQNTIFEEGNYRVDAKSQQLPSGQVTIDISVRDKYSNVSHYDHHDEIGLPPQTPAPVTIPSSLPIEQPK